VAELEAARTLIAATEAESQALRGRLETEKRLTRALEELVATQRSETGALRSALAASSEALTAKDAVIASQERLVAELKKSKSSPWRRLGDILLGAAAVAVLR
jgi:septal ring factor EnvC (AmiA/AmiB activator)